MLREYLEQLCKELEIELPKLDGKKIFPLRLGKYLIHIKDLDPGVAMQGQICPCPKRKKEELFIYLMRANLLGQGTGGARIGIDKDDNFLTLSLGLPYEINYQIFRENVENFANYLIHWQREVAKFENEQNASSNR